MPSPRTKTGAVPRSSIVEVVRGTETDEQIVIEMVELLRVTRRNEFVATFPDSSMETARPCKDAAPPHAEEVRPLFGSAVLTVRPIDRTMA